jgi:hypothetical protein
MADRGHLTKAEVSIYCTKWMDEEAVKEIEAHLLVCGVCTAAVFRESLKGLPQDEL